MKQSIDLLQEDLTPNEIEYILSWKKRKYKNDKPTLSFGEVVELIIAITFNFYKDSSDGRFFNNILVSEESVIGYDGEEPIDTFFYELQTLLHKRFSRSDNILEEKIR